MVQRREPTLAQGDILFLSDSLYAGYVGSLKDITNMMAERRHRARLVKKKTRSTTEDCSMENFQVFAPLLQKVQEDVSEFDRQMKIFSQTMSDHFQELTRNVLKNV